VGLVVSILQAATQIQEITLTFVPKIVVTGIVLVIAGPWMLDRVTGYTTQLFVEIPRLVAPS
jgi:flagellar biosynthetic protein FliQ